MDNKPPITTPPKGPRPPRAVNEIVVAMELPFILVGSVVITGALGYWIDKRLHTSPLFLMLLGLLGFIAGVREILRRVSKGEKNNGGQ